MTDTHELVQRAKQLIAAVKDPTPFAERRDRAIQWLEEAGATGDVEAMDLVGQQLQYVDIERAFTWLVRAAQHGSLSSLVALLANSDLPRERARSVLEAATGEAWAQTAVGLVFLGGLAEMAGIGPDPSRTAREVGLDWLERAVANGWRPAALALAGQIQDHDHDRACSLARMAAHDGSVPALRLLASLLGKRGETSPEAFECNERLATAGDASAWTWLGDRHRLGEGVARDASRAVRCYREAVSKADAAACRELAKLYEAGDGVAPDDTLARELYERAAELGNDQYARDRLAEKWGLAAYRRKISKQTKKPRR